MIKKVNNFSCISGGNSSLMSVIKTDFHFPSSDSDGVYVQEREGVKTLVLSLKGDSATICNLKGNGDIEELCAFLRFWNIKNIVSDFFFQGFFFQKKILMKAEPTYALNEKCTVINPSSRIDDYRMIFNLISENGDFCVWYPAFSKKINKAFASGAALFTDNTCVSCAVAPYIQGENAVVAGVVTHNQYRKKGYATMCVQSLLSDLKSKDVKTAFLWCDPKNIKFYEKTGFIICGEVYIKEDC